MFTHSLRRFVPVTLFLACAFSNSVFTQSNLEVAHWNVELFAAARSFSGQTQPDRPLIQERKHVEFSEPVDILTSGSHEIGAAGDRIPKAVAREEGVCREATGAIVASEPSIGALLQSTSAELRHKPDEKIL